MTRSHGTETGGAPAPLMSGQTAPTFLGVPAPRGVGHLRGSTSFPKAARDALQNTQLRRNLGHATQVIRTKRAHVVGELDDWEQLRLAGEAMKRSTMARLDEHLERLEREVTARGGVVHWARDANEANAIVTRVVQETGETEVVKVKSMATQEIGLNEALESAGMTPYETDLAELIVQLGHDMPSHILVPAIHRNRAEIREIFLREMAGVDPQLTDDPRRLAEAARSYLRKKFLTAKVGISGANFGIAETGTLLVVESEGNGRTAVLADEVGREALHCIRCSACLNVCPVYERTGGHAYGSVYPGPIGAVLSPQLTGVEDNASLPYASSLCGACYDVCPVAIDIPSILVHLRAEHVEAQTRTTPEAVAFRALSTAMSHPRLWRLAQRAAGLGRFLARGRPTLPNALPPPASRWTRSRDLPTPPAKTFTQQWAEEHRS